MPVFKKREGKEKAIFLKLLLSWAFLVMTKCCPNLTYGKKTVHLKRRKCVDKKEVNI